MLLQRPKKFKTIQDKEKDKDGHGSHEGHGHGSHEGHGHGSHEGHGKENTTDDDEGGAGGGAAEGDGGRDKCAQTPS